MTDTLTQNGAHTPILTDREQWLAERRKGIGASEIAAVIGVDAYRSALDIYLSKVEGIKSEPNEHMRAGTLLEPVILTMYEEAEDCVVARNRELIVHPDNPVWRCTPDAFRPPKTMIVQAKNTSRMVDPDAALDQGYYAQVQYEMGVAGDQWSHADVAYLCQGYKLVVKRVERDQSVIDYLFEQAHDFWERYILTRTPPTHDLHPGDVTKLYPTHIEGKIIEAGAELATLVSEYAAAHARAKDFEAVASGLKEQIQLTMGDAEGVSIAGRLAATWKTARPSTVLDDKALKNAEPNTWRRYAVERPGSRRFLLKGGE